MFVFARQALAQLEEEQMQQEMTHKFALNLGSLKETGSFWVPLIHAPSAAYLSSPLHMVLLIMERLDCFVTPFFIAQYSHCENFKQFNRDEMERY